jgi:hypothetical protein
MVWHTLGMVTRGCSARRVVEAYPELTEEDVIAALEFRTRLVDDVEVLVGVQRLCTACSMRTSRLRRIQRRWLAA